jgi:hypothetical protein
MPTVTFIGGPIDGQRREVEELTNVYTVDRMNWNSPRKFRFDAAANFGTISVVYYRLVQLRGEKSVFNVYAAERMTMDSILAALLLHYLPKKEEG